MPQISVLIPTRDRADLLEKCLISLAEQTLDAGQYEICVIDNGSTDPTPQAVERVKNLYPQRRIFRIYEPQPGPSPARNAGIAATTAPLIASTDDDATVPPDWLEKFLATFAALPADVGKVGGEIIPVWGAPRPGWLSDNMLPLLSAATGFGAQARYMNEGLLEGNSCYRRDALAAAGNFSVTLGRKGGALLSAEHAVDLVMNVGGWKLYYEPAITINHLIHADRLTPAWIRRRYFWQGVSDYAVHVYLNAKGIKAGYGIKVQLPLDPQDWNFVENSIAVPTEPQLLRLRGLGFVLASSGFIDVG